MIGKRSAQRAETGGRASPNRDPLIVLLGPQRLKPTLPAVLAECGVEGSIAIITAGWQEREEEDAELSVALGGRAKNLRLYARAEEVLKKDRELADAHRQRQERLRAMQELYRIRLDYGLEAVNAIRRRGAPPDAIESAIAAVRTLDADHLVQCSTIYAEFEATHRTADRPLVARHRRELEQLVDDSAALAIAGGHVAVLLNRLRLFAVQTTRPIFAWSAGAMALTERVVLFHDSPPQGPGNAEVLDAGLGLVRGVVALPSPRRRLRLDDRERVALYARRFAPASCLAFDDGTHAVFDPDLSRSQGVVTLEERA